MTTHIKSHKTEAQSHGLCGLRHAVLKPNGEGTPPPTLVCSNATMSGDVLINGPLHVFYPMLHSK